MHIHPLIQNLFKAYCVASIVLTQGRKSLQSKQRTLRAITSGDYNHA